MDTRFVPRSEPVQPALLARGACLVEGCPCKDARIISARRVAFFSQWAREHGETAERCIEPDDESRELLRPWRDRLLGSRERPDLPSLTKGPSKADLPGW